MRGRRQREAEEAVWLRAEVEGGARLQLVAADAATARAEALVSLLARVVSLLARVGWRESLHSLRGGGALACARVRAKRL